MRPGNVLIATKASSTRAALDAWSFTPSRWAPRPRMAVVTSEVAWFTTIATYGPSLSSAQRLVAQYGSRRDAFVEPSTGSMTTVIGAEAGPETPDSSLTTANSRPPSTPRAAASAIRSIAYWPGRAVRARRASPVTGPTARVIASHTSPNSSRRRSGSIGASLARRVLRPGHGSRGPSAGERQAAPTRCSPE